MHDQRDKASSFPFTRHVNPCNLHFSLCGRRAHHGDVKIRSHLRHNGSWQIRDGSIYISESTSMWGKYPFTEKANAGKANGIVQIQCFTRIMSMSEFAEQSSQQLCVNFEFVQALGLCLEEGCNDEEIQGTFHQNSTEGCTDCRSGQRCRHQAMRHKSRRLPTNVARCELDYIRYRVVMLLYEATIEVSSQVELGG